MIEFGKIKNHPTIKKLSYKKHFCQEKTLKNWKSFITQLMRKNFANLLWRGQADSNWLLMSSYIRNGKFNKKYWDWRTPCVNPHPMDKDYKNLILNLPSGLGNDFFERTSQIYNNLDPFFHDLEYFSSKFYQYMDKKEYRDFLFGTPLDFTFRTQMNLENWSWAQHYGTQTPLLDWTMRPLFALYMACDSYKDASSISIYSLNLKILSALNSYILPVPTNAFSQELKIQCQQQCHTIFKDIPIDDLIDEYLNTNLPEELFERNYYILRDAMMLKIISPESAPKIDRLQKQSGYFSFTPGGISIESWCERYIEAHKTELPIEQNEPLLLKINIPMTKADKCQCLRFLDAANINGQTVYPDFQGFGKYMTELSDRKNFF
ncbi:MAG: FRG domain-containing protein [Lentisphaerae bacterium]|nr:FRG domain-containing protein [Lentisphaerota bacterium]